MNTEPSWLTPQAAASAQRLRHLLARSPAVPYRLPHRHFTITARAMADRIRHAGPPPTVLGVPGTNSSIHPAEHIATHLNTTAHRLHQAPSRRAPRTAPDRLAGRVLLVAASHRGPDLTALAQRLTGRLLPGAWIETAALVLRNHLGITTTWWAWRLTGPVLFPWDATGNSNQPRQLPELEPVEISHAPAHDNCGPAVTEDEAADPWPYAHTPLDQLPAHSPLAPARRG
ncbi:MULTISPECIES: hypothetical protein [Streptomyces]|uniref:hypothetical protein n=1 Tax=Streptomyces TaxID=1883 RepID=UPI0004CC9408|nr:MULTISPECIES: hypothetical protein [Streptomyces]KOT52682.1 hypothetical protein ADK43_29870 [Streptomyces rimosus subsp. rimosus]